MTPSLTGVHVFIRSTCKTLLQTSYQACLHPPSLQAVEVVQTPAHRGSPSSILMKRIRNIHVNKNKYIWDFGFSSYAYLLYNTLQYINFQNDCKLFHLQFGALVKKSSTRYKIRRLESLSACLCIGNAIYLSWWWVHHDSCGKAKNRVDGVSPSLVSEVQVTSENLTSGRCCFYRSIVMVLVLVLGCLSLMRTT